MISARLYSNDACEPSAAVCGRMPPSRDDGATWKSLMLSMLYRAHPQLAFRKSLMLICAIDL